MSPRSRPLAAAVVAVVALAACSRVSGAPASAGGAPAAVAPPGVPAQQPLLPDHGTYSVLAKKRYLPVFDEASPSATQRFVFDTENPFGVRVPMLVTAARWDAQGGGWLKVLLPIRPNDAAGWVPASAVRVVPDHQKIVVDLSRRSLAHFVDGTLVDRFSVGIGRPEYPTATGTFYVWARVQQASPFGPYGVFALGISGFSEVLRNWPGGGRMAIHGTANPTDRGQMVSHGCIRVYNPDMAALRGVPLGTPVIIKA